MSSPEELRDWGVEPGYWDVTGRWRDVPEESLSAVLGALGAGRGGPPEHAPLVVVGAGGPGPTCPPAHWYWKTAPLSSCGQANPLRQICLLATTVSRPPWGAKARWGSRGSWRYARGGARRLRPAAGGGGRRSYMRRARKAAGGSATSPTSPAWSVGPQAAERRSYCRTPCTPRRRGRSRNRAPILPARAAFSARSTSEWRGPRRQRSARGSNVGYKGQGPQRRSADRPLDRLGAQVRGPRSIVRPFRERRP